MKRTAEFLYGLPLRDKPAEQEGYFNILAALGFYSVKTGREHTAPVGYKTNYVTGQKLWVVRRIVQDKMKPGAVIHDLLYETGAVSRALADAVFLEALLVLGVARWRAYAAYAAVRACGWKFYKAAAPTGVKQDPVGELEREPELE